MNTDDLSGLLTALSVGIDKENAELYQKIIGSSEIKSFNGPDEFYYAVLYPWSKFIRGFIQANIKDDDDLCFIYKHSQYIDNSFQELFMRHEGSACCADKSRTIVDRLAHFYNTGEKIVFDYDSKYSFGYPKKIFKNHDEIVAFYEGLRDMYHGRPDRYLKALKSVFG